MSRRASSRRSFLAAGAATAWAAGSVGAIHAAARAAEPDPVRALIECERRALDGHATAIHERDKCETAFKKSGWDRQPRALNGYMRRVCEGPDCTPIPSDRQVEEPIYLSKRHVDSWYIGASALARETKCSDNRVKWIQEVDAERDRLMALLDEDAAAIETAK